ncbi:MAG TPA: biopolymer transporter ExbD [Bacteroidia bacterium]|jgi:biopolymer transport protein ExbD
MKLKLRHKEGAEVSTESLNDIMFFLLLFFLIVATLANPSVLKLSVPGAGKKDAKPVQVIAEVDADHQYKVNKLPIAFTDLEDALKVELERTKASSILLVFDNTLSIQDLADVMQIGYGLGTKMVLETKASKK